LPASAVPAVAAHPAAADPKWDDLTHKLAIAELLIPDLRIELSRGVDSPAPASVSAHRMSASRSRSWSAPCPRFALPVNAPDA